MAAMETRYKNSVKGRVGRGRRRGGLRTSETGAHRDCGGGGVAVC